MKQRNFYYLVDHKYPETDPVPGYWSEAVRLDWCVNLAYFVRHDDTIISVLCCPTFKDAKRWADSHNEGYERMRKERKEAAHNEV